ncbi:MAG: hypothetical protein LBT74_02665 [Acidobacteriota bacterium]|jgi:hypothetical protein|nr:hypothetical protein [Acidobacteriota bacterium]
MPKSFKAAVAALAVATLGAALYNWFAFADERRVQKVLRELEGRISQPSGAGLDMALAGAALKPLLAPDVDVTVLRDGREWRRRFGRDELLRAILSAKRRNPGFAVGFDFSRRDVKLVGGGAATVVVNVRVENLGEPVEPQRLTFALSKSGEGDWRLDSIGRAP